MLKNYRNKLSLLILLSALLLQSCKTLAPWEESEEFNTMKNIIPRPVTAEQITGAFTLEEGANIYVEPWTEENERIGKYLADKLNPATGFNMQVLPATNIPET